MNEQWMPGNKKELMSAIDREWKLLIDLADRLTDAQMTTPDSGGWSPKDNFAHLAEWMNVLMGYHIDHRPSHEVLNVTPDVTEGWDMNKINPVIFERNRHRSRKEVLDQLRQAYDKLMARLDSMSFEDLMMPRHADDPQKRPLLIWVLGDTSEHFLEHRETVERGLQANRA